MKISERYDYMVRVEYDDGHEETWHFDDEEDARDYAYDMVQELGVIGAELCLMDWYMHQDISLDYIEP